MNYYAGVDIDKGEVAIVSRRGGSFSSIYNLKFSDNTKDLESIWDDIEEFIIDAEKKLSTSIYRFYFSLPYSYAKVYTGEDVLPLTTLGKTRKVKLNDIISLKKILEGAILEWDDKPIHHMIDYYEVDFKRYDSVPIGVWGRKLKIHSVIVSCKQDFYTRIENMLDSRGRTIIDFVYAPFCYLSLCFSEKDQNDDNFILVDLGEKNTYISLFLAGKYRHTYIYPFSQKMIIEGIQKRFSLPYDIAVQIFTVHFSFTKENTSIDKEITLKNSDDTYIKLSYSSVSSFIKNFCRDKLCEIDSFIKNKIGGNFKVYFSGKLGHRPDFCSFSREVLSDTDISPLTTVSSSLGCVKYGVTKFMEKLEYKKRGIIHTIQKIYNEYF